MTEQTRRQFIKNAGAAVGTVGSIATGLASRTTRAASSTEKKTDYQVGAYYFPNYHADPRNEKLYGKGWTEWELVKQSRPRFEGHRQPLVPTWGYLDEADPKVMEMKIDVAADHGIDYWIFD